MYFIFIYAAIKFILYFATLHPFSVFIWPKVLNIQTFVKFAYLSNVFNFSIKFKKFQIINNFIQSLF